MSIGRDRVIVNPGHKRKARAAAKQRKRMTAKQIRYFGTKRQKAALKAKHSNPKKSVFHSSKRRTKKFLKKKGLYDKAHRKSFSRTKRDKNVGSILTVLPGTLGIGNPGRKRKRKSNMARKAKSRKRRMPAGLRRYWAKHRRKRSGNPGHRARTRTRTVVKYRYRGKARHHRRHSRRGRNPGILTGATGQVFGVIGGATVTSMLTGFVPASFMSGFLKYIAIGLIAYLQGTVVGKVSRNAALGKDFTVGGFTYLALQVIKDFMPSLSGTLGVSGMGIIGGSNYWVPQIPVMGNMGAFVPPAMLAAAAAPAVAAGGMHGIGSMRRMGRIR